MHPNLYLNIIKKPFQRNIFNLHLKNKKIIDMYLTKITTLQYS